ncbi:sigma-54 dependent transcriptional regulator [Geobacter grbiciae]|uniref:sigma-54 dependent transcriptional regulator n=1 Tax=Geobacter grbiciae TaxID=155042 RepID=UPI001C029EBF|nr:sigma-54 dependent transcriptional regulator [Geobacter grbiciae]MBT1074570.1 sigma-54 dependent transcriptional regulator [Geobacter grbiciae]
MSKRGTLLFSLGTHLHLPIHELDSAGWEVHVATNLPDARTIIRERDLQTGMILLDDPYRTTLGNMEDIMLAGDSMEWIALLTEKCLQSPVLCRFVAENCFDYHTLPLDAKRLSIVLGHAVGKAELKSRVSTRRKTYRDDELVGESPAIQEIYQKMRKMEGVDAPILISGESGTGKELVANIIHKHSARAKGPFVAVNCGALPPHLIQTELFGHEKGAFTGAIQRTVGRIEFAAGGTIFLDEMGDLPFELQTNLLRFLQEKTIERVGSHQSITIDARVIAATNVDLEKSVAEGRFREDLYYRLNVLSLKMPPLRDRSGDIELLAMAFLEKFSNKRKLSSRRFNQQALRCMNLHSWPGNVRELINRVQRAVIMSDGPFITPADLGLERRSATRNLLTLEKARDKAEKEAIQYSLLCHRNNISETARQLRVSRATLYRLMNKFQITV